MPFVNDCQGDFTVAFRTAPGGGSRITELLWGDPVHLAGQTDGDFTQVFARGRADAGWMPTDCLTDDGLLEFYVIDVGQGDSVLIRTPDDRWHLIDGGVSNERQMTGKGAANFIRWKFLRDLRRPAVELATITISHPDFDHYGGLLNLLSGDLGDGRAPLVVNVERLYHNGMGRFDDDDEPLGATSHGQVAPFPIGGHNIRRRDGFITELLDGREDFINPSKPFTATFGELAGLIHANVGLAARIGCAGNAETFLQDYGPTDGVRGPGNTPLTVKILGPIFETFTEEGTNAQLVGLRELANDSKTRNGHSVILRFDYGDARILMTGDLNNESQRLLMNYIQGSEYAADVAKGCHHGSEDVDFRFLAAIQARATVISSGDNESFSHPRPVVIGGSCFHGRQIVTPDGDALPPLLYSTELARSVRLAQAERVRVDHDEDPDTMLRSFPIDRAEVRPRNGTFRRFSTTPISTDLVYGLVNIRTDGRRILCATLEEVGTEFDVKVFQAGVAPE